MSDEEIKYKERYEMQDKNSIEYRVSSEERIKKVARCKIQGASKERKYKMQEG